MAKFSVLRLFGRFKDIWAKASLEAKIGIIGLVVAILAIVVPIFYDQSRNATKLDATTPTPSVNVTSIPTFAPLYSAPPAPTIEPYVSVTPAIPKTATAQANATTVATGALTDTECLKDTSKGTALPDSFMSEMLFDFEGLEVGEDTYNWTINEAGFFEDGSVRSEITDQIAHCGSQSLKVTTNLDGRRTEDKYHHTVMTVYFDRTKPETFTPGPYLGYDLRGKTIECFVYIPPDFPVGGDNLVNMGLFVKDRQNANLGGEVVDITKENVGKWIMLELTIKTNSEHADKTFNSQEVNALGFAILIPPSSNLRFKGSIYIDDCSIRETTGEDATS